jgi:hypothetical protein
MDAHP